jgi:hypothetical protein
MGRAGAFMAEARRRQARRGRRATSVDSLAKRCRVGFVDEMGGVDGDEARIAKAHIPVVVGTAQRFGKEVDSGR